MERKRNWGGMVAAILVILILGGGALFGYWAWGKATERTMPTIATESANSYATNISNALMNSRELEVAPELLTGLISEITGKELACAVTPDSRMKLWYREDIPVLGTTDVALEMGIEAFDATTGELTLRVQDIYLGTLQLPTIFHDRAMALAKTRFGSEKVNINGTQVRFAIPKLQAALFGVQFAAGVNAVTLREGKLYLGLFADANLDLIEAGEALGGLLNPSSEESAQKDVPEEILQSIPQEILDQLPEGALDDFPNNIPEEYRSMLDAYFTP